MTDNDLVNRIREALSTERTVREVTMFGCDAFMVNDKLLVGVRKGGDLLVRVAATDAEQLLEQPGAQRASMGAGRTMGVGWIDVDATAVDDDQLEFWLAAALDHNRRVASQA